MDESSVNLMRGVSEDVSSRRLSLDGKIGGVANERVVETLVWSLLKSGVVMEADRVASLDVHSCLHVLALNNCAADIRALSTLRGEDFKQACLRPDENGYLPAMVAAVHNNKEALLALLAPFLVCPKSCELDKLLHHKSANGQSVMSCVVHHRESLFAAHGILVEFEAAMHRWDSWAVKNCLRTSLGSSQGAKATLELYSRIEKKECANKRTAGHLSQCMKIFTFVVLLRSLVLVLDVITDMLLLFGYFEEWTEDVSQVKTSSVIFPGPLVNPKDPCLKTESVNLTNVIGSHFVPKDDNVPLECYIGAMSPQVRFTATLVVIMLPWLFYFFELLRFRIFSRWLEENHCFQRLPLILLMAFKLVTNCLLWLLWPLVAFFRQFFYQLRFETSMSAHKAGRDRESARLANTIGSRTQIIEVCTEASLQPLLQLYVVLINFITWKKTNVEGRESIITLDFLFDDEKRRLVSVFVSLLAIAWSYTAQYRANKERALGHMATAMYFTSIYLFVTARILCFEMFAYYQGPGHFSSAMAAVAGHALLMSAIHFVFSDSVRQCARQGKVLTGAWVRQILLVVHNCFINGLANIYVHNNLEIFVHYDQDEAEEANETPTKTKRRKKSVGVSYTVSDIRQQTLVRQLVIDGIILLENVAMLYLAKGTVTSTVDFPEVYYIIVMLTCTCYIGAMLLKITFYCCCHPWAELIRPNKSQINTSVIVFSRQVNLRMGLGKKCQLSLDPYQDRLRYQSTKMDRIHGPFA